MPGCLRLLFFNICGTSDPRNPHVHDTICAVFSGVSNPPALEERSIAVIVNILIFMLSIVPSVFIFLWLRNRHRDDPLYIKSCNSAFIRGLVCVLPILALSGVLFLINGLLRVFLLQNAQLLYKAIYNFVVLAFAEELVKFTAFRLLLKKKLCAYSRADVVALMVIIGTAFGLIEDIPYAIGADAITMLVRGFTMGHVGYGFLTGWFYSKMLYTGKKRYGVIAFVFPWLLHGLYDFSLSRELLELNDNLAIVAVALALADIVLLVLMFRFFLRARKKDIYNTPVTEAADAVPASETVCPGADGAD